LGTYSVFTIDMRNYFSTRMNLRAYSKPVTGREAADKHLPAVLVSTHVHEVNLKLTNSSLLLTIYCTVNRKTITVPTETNFFYITRKLLTWSNEELFPSPTTSGRQQ
jgi:hypothetical protein